MRKIKKPYKQDNLGISCCDITKLEILGTGNFNRKGKTTKRKWCDHYYCKRCKRVYIDCHFHGLHGYSRGSYSPRATRQYLTEENQINLLEEF